MTEYTLSVVQLCPGAHKDAANAIAEASGFGPNNLSVELRGPGDSVWWGCHAWWIPEVLAAAVNPPDEVPGTGEILTHVVTSVAYSDGLSDAELATVAPQHWQAALAANGLSVVPAA